MTTPPATVSVCGKKAFYAVASASGSALSIPHQVEFGINEWLVDEFRERYLRDPDSVDRVWRDYFRASAPHRAPYPRPPERPRARRQCRSGRATPTSWSRRSASPH
ncbi:hypothetical protein ACFQ51_34000 [Streptomyces kaempferi]